jgi:hypothetical protein
LNSVKFSNAFIVVNRLTELMVVAATPARQQCLSATCRSANAPSNVIPIPNLNSYAKPVFTDNQQRRVNHAEKSLDPIGLEDSEDSSVLRSKEEQPDGEEFQHGSSQLHCETV